MDDDSTDWSGIKFDLDDLDNEDDTLIPASGDGYTSQACRWLSRSACTIQAQSAN